MRDKIFSQKLEKLEAFKFDAGVAEVFADMISRSVPLYERILQLLPLFLEKYLQENQENQEKSMALKDNKLKVYDLGASLGATSLALAHYLENFAKETEAEFFLVDNSEAMLQKCEQIVKELKKSNRAGDFLKNIDFQFLLEDIRKTQIENADLIILNFTLQFLNPSDRLEMLEKIYAGLKKGGYFILSEKIHFADEEQEFLQDIYWRFKAFNGYSQIEISQKRTALENVLITETLEEHKQRLKQAGFSKVFLWLQEFNFISLIGIK